MIFPMATVDVDNHDLPITRRWRNWGLTPDRTLMPDWRPRLPEALVEALADAWSSVLLARLHRRSAP